MSCEWTEKISQLMDDELAAEEMRRMKQHLFSCPICRQAHQEFVALRERLQSYQSYQGSDQHAAAVFARQQALRRILASRPARFWQSPVVLPVPVVMGAMLLVIALVAVISLIRWRQDERRMSQPPGALRIVKPGEQSQDAAVLPGQIDFSRYDKGERAVIYKTRRNAAQ